MENTLPNMIVGGLMLLFVPAFGLWLFWNYRRTGKEADVLDAQRVLSATSSSQVYETPVPTAPIRIIRPVPVGQVSNYIEHVLGEARDTSEATVLVDDTFTYTVTLLPPKNLCTTAEFMDMLASQAVHYGLRYELAHEYEIVFTRLQ